MTIHLSQTLDPLPLIALQGVTKVYGHGQAVMPALRGMDLGIHAGDFVAMMGPSGSGKSTCMNILGCLDTPTEGTYRFRGIDVGQLSRQQRALLRRHYIGFVFQGFNLLARTSALENVKLPLIYRGIAVKERRERSRQALQAVGLSGWETHTPSELSGGQQQRVAMARAIVTSPAVLLADELTGNLDSGRSQEIMELLTAFNRDQGITIVMVTHEPAMAAYAQRIVHFLEAMLTCDVIGLLAAKGQSLGGRDQDDIVLVPLRTFWRRLAGNQDVQLLQVAARDGMAPASVQRDIEKLLRERRRITPNEADDFSVMDLQEVATTLTGTTQLLTTLLRAVAAVSLLVGCKGQRNFLRLANYPLS